MKIINNEKKNLSKIIGSLALELLNYKKFLIIGALSGAIFSLSQTSIFENRIYVLESILAIPYTGTEQIIDPKKLSLEIKSPGFLNTALLVGPEDMIFQPSLIEKINQIYYANQINKDFSGITLITSGENLENEEKLLQIATNLLSNFLSQKAELIKKEKINRRNAIGKNLNQLITVRNELSSEIYKQSSKDALVSTISAINKLEADFYQINREIESTNYYLPIIKQPTYSYSFKNRKGLMYWLNAIFIGSASCLLFGLIANRLGLMKNLRI